ncbi:hypothetical protein CCACVL1_06173, partial [Corchorus capsularis]
PSPSLIHVIHRVLSLPQAIADRLSSVVAVLDPLSLRLCAGFGYVSLSFSDLIS